MMYRLTFSRPGAALPYAQAYQRAAGAYGPDEIVPLGGALEVLPGHFSGAGNIMLDRVPQSRDGVTRCAPRDWVRVYLGADPDPVYLGEVASEPRSVDGQRVTLTLAGLKDRVSRARWKSDVGGDGKALPFKARFKTYFQGVLARAVLPPGVTVGPLPDLDVTLRAVTLSELVGDAFQQALAATQGGTWGVDALARVGVALPNDALTHRFVRRDSDRPAGDVTGYANCIRFGYRRPSGDESFFEYRYGLGVAEFGESWLMDNLPSSVTTTLTNPYAALPVRVYSYLTYPGENPALTVGRDVSLMAMAPSWTGHLGDGVTWDTGVLSGGALQLRATGQDAYTFRTLVEMPLTFGPLLAELRLQVELPGNPTQTIGAKDGTGAGQPGSPAWTYEPAGLPAGAVVRYHPADLLAYQAAHGVYPKGFNLSVRASGGGSLRIVRGAAPVMDPTRVVLAENDYAVPASGAAQLVPAPPMLLPMAADLHLPTFYQWRAGDQVTTDAHVTAVTIYDSVTRQQFVLTRAADDPETGRRVWTLPGDARADGMMVAGDLRQIGWVGLNLTDEAGLLAYAVGRLLPLLTPVRSWVGRYPDLRRLTVAGVARFDDEGGDLDLNVTRGRYDLTNGRSVIEAGTPQAYDDIAAIEQAFGAIERVQRLSTTPGGDG